MSADEQPRRSWQFWRKTTPFEVESTARTRLSRLILILDLAGTFLFAIQGALRAIDAHLDLLGVIVLSIATAVGGGIVRDILIGATPPQALRDWRYVTIAFSAGAIAFVAYPFLKLIPAPLLICLDAAGLSLFAVAGIEKAFAYGLNASTAVLMGTVTAVGGGMIRDVLLAQVPVVLRIDIYATAALAGSLVLIICRKLGLENRASAILGGVTCFALRLIAVWLHWHLPVAATS